MELTHNILWLLKQTFYFSYRFVNDAISSTASPWANSA